MGFFDLLSPLLAATDQFVAGLLPSYALRVALWGLVSGVFCMALYARLSNQQQLDEVKQRTASLRQQVNNFDGEYEDLQPLAVQLIKSALHQVRITLMPAVLASLPVLFLLAFLSNHYNYAPLEAGTAIELRAEGGELCIDPPAQALGGNGYKVIWPSDGSSVPLSDINGVKVAELPGPAPGNVLHKETWWNLLFANPAGYIPDNAALELVFVDLPYREIISVGPAWVRSWEILYFTLLIAASLLVKWLFKIH